MRNRSLQVQVEFDLGNLIKPVFLCVHIRIITTHSDSTVSYSGFGGFTLGYYSNYYQSQTDGQDY